MQVAAAPLPLDNSAALVSDLKAAALLIVHDPSEQTYIPQNVIRSMFGLTPTEAQLLLAVSNGQSLKEYCDEHDVTHNTARTHLRSVFAKTSTSKQSDLVRLMSGTHALCSHVRAANTGAPSVDDDAIRDLIGAIYEAASETKQWGPVVRQIKVATNSHFAKLWFGDPNYNALEFATRPSDFLAFEHPELSLSDLGDLVRSFPDPSSFTEPYAKAVSRNCAPLGQVMNGHELVPIDDFRRSEWFHLMGKPFGMVHTIGAIIEPQAGKVGGLTFYRADEKPNYGRGEQRLLDALVPHIRRSLNLLRQLRLADAKSQILQSSIDTLRSAIVLIGGTGKVVFFNAAAGRLLKRCPDLAVRRDRLQATSHTDSVALEQLTKRAMGADGRRPIGGAVTIQRAGNGLPLQVVAAPISADNRTVLASSGHAVALLVIHDPNGDTSIPQEIVATLFGLTPMEGTLLVALSEGQTLRQYSDDHCVTYNTARTHLRNVFAKTNTSKQSDLVRLMSGVTHSVAVGTRSD